MKNKSFFGLIPLLCLFLFCSSFKVIYHNVPPAQKLTKKQQKKKEGTQKKIYRLKRKLPKVKSAKKKEKIKYRLQTQQQQLAEQNQTNSALGLGISVGTLHLLGRIATLSPWISFFVGPWGVLIALFGGWIASITALIFAIIGMKKAKKGDAHKGLSRAALITSIISTILFTLILLTILAAFLIVVV